MASPSAVSVLKESFDGEPQGVGPDLVTWVVLQLLATYSADNAETLRVDDVLSQLRECSGVTAESYVHKLVAQKLNTLRQRDSRS